MMRIILVIALIAAIIWFLSYYQRLPASARNAALVRAVLYLTAGILLLLVATGRISWVFALIGAALPWINRLQMVHSVWKLFSKNKQKQSDSAPLQETDMSLQQAYRILGIDADAKEDEVIKAHRKQMQINHPDRGGSDYIAQQINLARDIILQNIKNK